MNKAFSIIFLLSTFGLTQTNNSAPATVTQKLREHHIGLTKSDLVTALHNSDAEVRALAAQQLVDERAKDTTDAIAEALALETDAKAEVNIAYALAQLGDQRGIASLTKTCGASDRPGWIRVRAASYLATTKDESCLEDIVVLLASNPEPVDRADALAILPDFKNVTGALAARIDAVIIQAFSDPDPHVRITAADVAAERGTVSAVPYLSAAIEKERDNNIRNTLQRAQKSLQKQTRQIQAKN